LEGLWVSWGLNQLDQKLLNQLLDADDYRARAAAIRAVRYMGHQIANPGDMLIEAASDEHGRVRLEAIVASSWMDQETGLQVTEAAAQKDLDKWIVHAHATTVAHLNGRSLEEEKEEVTKSDLKGADLVLFNKGKEIYQRDGSCMTCHQVDGKGLDASGFPPLAGTKWVLASEDRLIKIVLNGLYGSIKVLGKQYPGQVPMTPQRGLLNDEEMAGVLTYVRNAFGNKASVIGPEKVKEIRAATTDKEGFYTPEELLEQHPDVLVN
jgi:mono/diheme cytochrome c family protein